MTGNAPYRYKDTGSLRLPKVSVAAGSFLMVFTGVLFFPAVMGYIIAFK